MGVGAEDHSFSDTWSNYAQVLAEAKAHHAAAAATTSVVDVCEERRSDGGSSRHKGQKSWASRVMDFLKRPKKRYEAKVNPVHEPGKVRARTKSAPLQQQEQQGRDRKKAQRSGPLYTDGSSFTPVHRSSTSSSHLANSGDSPYVPLHRRHKICSVREPAGVCLVQASMASRGRGRGRGRGRFGARGIGLPVARDEDGTIIVAAKLDGPPPLYPKVSLPDLPSTTGLSDRETYLIVKKRALEAAWNASPYYVEELKPGMPALADVQRYSDRYRPELRLKRAPLSTFLKLGPAFFPAELLGQDRKRAQGTKGAASNQWLLEPALQQKNDLQRLDQLSALEQKIAKQEDAKGGKDGDKEKKAGEEDGDGDGEEVEDDGEDMDEDDYTQIYGFDDDDDLNLDMDDGGEDEGAIF